MSCSFCPKKDPVLVRNMLQVDWRPCCSLDRQGRSVPVWGTSALGRALQGWFHWCVRIWGGQRKAESRSPCCCLVPACRPGRALSGCLSRGIMQKEFVLASESSQALPVSFMGMKEKNFEYFPSLQLHNARHKSLFSGKEKDFGMECEQLCAISTDILTEKFLHILQFWQEIEALSGTLFFWKTVHTVVDRTKKNACLHF